MVDDFFYSFSVNSFIEVNINSAHNITFRISEGAYITKKASIEAPIIEAMPIGTTKMLFLILLNTFYFACVS